MFLPDLRVVQLKSSPIGIGIGNGIGIGIGNRGDLSMSTLDRWAHDGATSTVIVSS